MLWHSCFLLSLALNAVRVNAASAEGPYIVSMRNVDACKSPATPLDPNYPKVDVSLRAENVSGTDQEIKGEVTYRKDAVIDKILILIKTEDPSDPDPLTIKKEIKKPCDNPFMGVILKKLLKLDDNCAIKTGTFKIDGIIPNKVSHLLFRGFHYGTFHFMMEWASKTGLVNCIESIVDIRKP